MLSAKQKAIFTLIELLIVIAIILILMSLIQPALKRVRDNAFLVDCMNKLKNNYLGLGAYADDHNGRFPLGNAGINPGNGYGTTYDLKLGNPYGLGIVFEEGYMQEYSNMYCSFWEHPFNQADVIETGTLDPWFPRSNDMGGWNPEGKRPNWHMGISYAYRGTMGQFANLAPNPSLDDPETAVLADHFSRREVLYGKQYGHPNSYNCVYLDGSVTRIEDHGHFWMEVRQPHGDAPKDDWVHHCKNVTNGITPGWSWKQVDLIFNDFFEGERWE